MKILLLLTLSALAPTYASEPNDAPPADGAVLKQALSVRDTGVLLRLGRAWLNNLASPAPRLGIGVGAEGAVSNVFAHGPAAAAGLAEGDVIEAVAGAATRGLDGAAVAGLLREAADPVQLQLAGGRSVTISRQWFSPLPPGFHEAARDRIDALEAFFQEMEKAQAASPERDLVAERVMLYASTLDVLSWVQQFSNGERDRDPAHWQQFWKEDNLRLKLPEPNP